MQGEPHGEVRVSYHRLEPGTFVAFTPQSKDFQKAVQEADVDLEALLQGTLMQHTALSEGDWISVTVPALVVSTGENPPLNPPSKRKTVSIQYSLCSAHDKNLSLSMKHLSATCLFFCCC